MNMLNKMDYLMSLKGLNKSKLSKLSGVPYMTISDMYKNGYTNVRISTVFKIGEALGVGIDYLMNDYIPMEKYTSYATECPQPPQTLTLDNTERKLVLDFRSMDSVGKQYVLQTVGLALMAYSNVVALEPSEQQNTAAARSGDRVEVNRVSPEEEDAALPPDFNGSDV